jgi:hypothetical protein
MQLLARRLLPHRVPAQLSVALLVGSTLLGLALVPLASWSDVREPTTRASFAMVVVGACVLALRGSQRVRAEQRLLAVFLAGMPLVYVEGSLWHGDVTSHFTELVGLVIYGGWAWLGAQRDARVLAGGIAAHGLAWDSWHHHSAAVPAWYATACMLVDVGWAGYVWLQRARWSA